MKYFNVTAQAVEKRNEFEQQKLPELNKKISEITEIIKNTDEDEGWHRLVIFSKNNKIFDGFTAAMRSQVLYFLRKHPNIITKLSDRETNANINRPFLYKWVGSDEKNNLGCKAVLFRGIDEGTAEKIFSRAESFDFFVDVCSVLEYLSSSKNKDEWQEITLFYLVKMCGLPMKNIFPALNFLLKMKLLLIAYVPFEIQPGRDKLFFHTINSEDEFEKTLESGNEIHARKILSDVDVDDSDFKTDVVQPMKKMSDTKIIKSDKPSDETLSIKNVSEELPEENLFTEEKISAEEKVSTDEKTPEKNFDMIHETTVGELGNMFDDVRKCLVSFNEIASSLFKNENQRNEIINGLLKMNEHQRQENENLVSQLTAMKKLLSKLDREKKDYLKRVQDALNLMMGQVATEADVFVKTPPHLMNEKTISAHKADIIKIAVQTANDIMSI